MERLEDIRFQLFSELVVISAHEDVGGGHGVGFLLLDVGDWTAAANGLFFAGQSGHGILQFLIRLIAGHEVMLEQCRFLFRGATFRFAGQHRPQRAVVVDRRHFFAGEAAAVDPDVLNAAAIEGLSFAALANAQWNGGADRSGQ